MTHRLRVCAMSIKRCVDSLDTEEALQAVVTRFAQAATTVGLTVSLKRQRSRTRNHPMAPTTHHRSALMGTASTQLSSSRTLEVLSQMMQR